MPAFIDITGQQFNRLLVVALHDKATSAKPRHNTRWICKCDCGEYTIVTSHELKRGTTKSCGCFKREKAFKHGGWQRPEYQVWNQMIRRCLNQNNSWFKHYGGRGIKVCDRWLSFANFWEDMGPRPDGYSIERINNDGNYEPANCKWIPLSDQQKNQRRPRREITSEMQAKLQAGRRSRRISQPLPTEAAGLQIAPASQEQTLLQLTATE